MYDTRGRMEQDIFMRYLDILEVPKRPPGFDALKELVAAQMTSVPFENISKLYYRKCLGLDDIPDMQTYLDGIERFHFGGTCYSNNYYFYLLLSNLGYATKLLARFFPDRSIVIHNLRVIKSQTTESKSYTLQSWDELGQTVEDLFGIPRAIVVDAVSELRDLADPWN